MGDLHSDKTSLQYLRDVLSVSVIITLPALVPEIFGWLQTICPIVSFYVVVTYGKDRGSIVLVKAILIASMLALFSGAMQALFYTIILLPLGFTLALSLRAQRSAEMTSFYGLITLIACYCGLWLVIVTTTGSNPYISLQTELGISLQQWADSALETAKVAGKEEGVLKQLEIGLHQVELYFPLILPGILLASFIFQVWLNLNLCSILQKKFLPNHAHWQDFRHWKLPDQLVWLFIFCGVALIFLQDITKVVCANGMIIFGFLYCLQGFAVLAFMLQKWQVPQAMRALIYILLIVPGYGLFMVSGLGLSDIWINFRTPRQQEKNHL